MLIFADASPDSVTALKHLDWGVIVTVIFGIASAVYALYRRDSHALRKGLAEDSKTLRAGIARDHESLRAGMSKDHQTIVKAIEEVKHQNDREHEKFWQVHSDDVRRLEGLALDHQGTVGKVVAIQENVREIKSDFKEFQRSPQKRVT